MKVLVDLQLEMKTTFTPFTPVWMVESAEVSAFLFMVTVNPPGLPSFLYPAGVTSRHL